jgi:16S rRNA (uracil1498-N3)-methyltransferase
VCLLHGLFEVASGAGSLVGALSPPCSDTQLMTRRRWIADEFSGNQAALIGAHAEHLVRVLRAHVGQEFDIATGTGVRLGRITKVTDQRVEFELGDEIAAVEVPNITVLLAIFKFDRMEWAIEKCTELGVSRIVPFVARRTDAHLAASAAKRVERWERIVRQAAEQSRRATPPQVLLPLELKEAVALTASTRIVLAETEEQVTLKDVLQSRSPLSDLLLAVGPEGGWADDEVALFSQAGWTSASLGNTILRAETGAIAATAIALSELS